jgi:hypothetical protein
LLRLAAQREFAVGVRIVLSHHQEQFKRHEDEKNIYPV